MPPILPRLVFCLAAVVGLASCGEPSRPAIGFTYTWGDSTLETFLRREINAGVGGDSIRFVSSRSGGWQSYGTSPLTAEVQRAVELAADPNVLAIVGPGGSREALQVAPIYAQARVADLIPTGTSRLLATAGDYTFVMAPNDSVQGAFLAAFADSALSARRYAIFYVPDEYGIGLATGTASALESRGRAILEREPVRLTQNCEDDAGRNYYRGVAEQLSRRGTPDAVVLALRTVEAACLTSALRARWPRLQLLAGDGVYLDEQFFRRAGTAGEGVYLTAFWHPELPGERSRRFLEEYQAVVGRVPRHGDAVFADAVLLAAEAIRAVGPDRERVADYLRSLGNTRPPYGGISGPVAFTPGFTRPLYMTRVEGSSSRLVTGQ